MKLSKTTKNYAKARKLYIELDTDDYIINNPKTKNGVVWFGLVWFR